MKNKAIERKLYILIDEDFPFYDWDTAERTATLLERLVAPEIESVIAKCQSVRNSATTPSTYQLANDVLALLEDWQEASQ